MAKKQRQKTIPLPFPFGGLSEHTAYLEQPQTDAGPTSPDLLNVRGYDPRTGRRRGSSRSGVSKYLSSQINSTASIQLITHAVGTNFAAIDGGQIVTGGPTGAFRLITAAGSLSVTDATANAAYQMSCWDDSGASYVAWKNTSTSVLNVRKITNAGATTWTIAPFTFDASGEILGMDTLNGVLYVLAYDVVGQTDNTQVLYRFSTTDGSAVSSNPWKTQATGLLTRAAGGTVPLQMALACGAGTVAMLGKSTGTSTIQYLDATTGTFSSNFSIATLTTEHDIVSDGRGNVIVVLSDNGGVAGYWVYRIPIGTAVPLWGKTGGTNRSACYDRVNDVVYACGNNVCASGSALVALGNYDGAGGVSVVDESDPQGVTTWHKVRTRSTGGAVVGNVNVGDDQLAAVDSSLTDVWTLTSASLTLTNISINNQPERSLVPNGRIVRSIAVAGGTVKLFDSAGTYAITSGTDALSPDAAVIFAAAHGNGKIFFADGAFQKYYNPGTNAITAWTLTAGTFPTSTSGNLPKLIVNWRGRIVLSGLGDGNWYMSRLGDPFDFDYSPATTDLIQAVASSNSNTGLIGDVINTMIPWTTDRLIVGGDRSIWVLAGDPMAGGINHLVSDSIGIAWGMPWCMDATGAVWFFGSRGGVYRMTGTQTPERMSQQIEERLADVNLSTTLVRMAYDDRQQCVHLWLTPLTSTTVTTHYVFDVRNLAWWADRYDDLDHSPKAVHVFDGDAPNDRVVLIGSWDGYVRYLNKSASTDDGQRIKSRVTIGPIGTRELDDYLLQDLHAVLAETSQPLNWEILQADTPQAAVQSGIPVLRGNWIKGRNPLSLVRRSGPGLYVRLSSPHPWSLEGLAATIEHTGDIRRRG